MWCSHSLPFGPYSSLRSQFIWFKLITAIDLPNSNGPCSLEQDFAQTRRVMVISLIPRR